MATEKKLFEKVFDELCKVNHVSKENIEDSMEFAVDYLMIEKIMNIYNLKHSKKTEKTLDYVSRRIMSDMENLKNVDMELVEIMKEKEETKQMAERVYLSWIKMYNDFLKNRTK